MKKTLSILMIAVLTALMLLTCASAEAADTVQVTDVLGREVTVNLPVENAFLGFYYENFLTVVGPDAFTRVKATSLYDTEGYFASLCRMYSENVEGYNDMVDIGSVFQDNFDIEKLIELECDCAIMPKYIYNRLGEETVAMLEGAGIPVVVIDYSTSTEATHTQTTSILGKVFQVEDRAEAINATYHEKLAEVAKRVEAATAGSEKVTTLHEYCSTMGSFAEIGASDAPTSLFGHYLVCGGAADISAPLFTADSGSFASLDMEYILEQDPQVWFLIGGEAANSDKDIVLMGYGVTEEDTAASFSGMLEARPAFETVQAVKNNKVFAVDNGMLRTLRDYTVIEFIAKALYPEAFEDVDPVADWKAFSETYLPQLPSEGTFMTQINIG